MAGPGSRRYRCAGWNEIFSRGTPALVNRSITLSSVPQVIGLTNPSGGGGE